MPIAVIFGPLGLGLPELIVLLAIPAALAVPVVAVILIARSLSGRRDRTAIASAPCPHCKQAIPRLGAFCSFCGQRVA